MIMARAGYHPDFVPALHHLLQARASSTASIYSMHPGWDTRDRQAQRFYATASIDFDRRWPDRYASPGGNPIIVGGKLIGAIGLSGGTGAQDNQASLAGVNALK